MDQEHLIDESWIDEQEYPSLLDRAQSSFIDLLLIVALMFLFSSILDKVEAPPDWVRIVMFFGIWAVYEPLFVTLGCTPGQYIKRIRVRQHDHISRRIGIFQAIFRYILKAFLGWLSFLTISFNKEKRAIHDFVAGSVMVRVKKRG